MLMESFGGDKQRALWYVMVLFLWSIVSVNVYLKIELNSCFFPNHPQEPVSLDNNREFKQRRRRRQRERQKCNRFNMQTLHVPHAFFVFSLTKGDSKFSSDVYVTNSLPSCEKSLLRRKEVLFVDRPVK